MMALGFFVKICGICDELTMRHVSAHASAAGIVVDTGSRRHVPPDAARLLLGCSSVPTYLVTRESDIAAWDRLLEATGARYAQVHAGDAHKTVKHLHDQHGIRIIQAFTVPPTTPDPPACAQSLIAAMSQSEADLLILDSGAGTGLMHDHEVSRIVAREYDIILAGGLSPETVADTISYVDPWGVDVSSGVEHNGRKDTGTITEFINIIRNGGESP